jgi:hypothetical protein
LLEKFVCVWRLVQREGFDFDTDESPFGEFEYLDELSARPPVGRANSDIPGGRLDADGQRATADTDNRHACFRRRGSARNLDGWRGADKVEDSLRALPAS